MGKSKASTLGISNGAVSKTQAAMTVGLLVLLAFLVGKTLMVFIAPDSYFKTPVTTNEVPKTIKNKMAATAFDFSFDPFHRAQTADVQNTAGLGEDAPETSLNLTLVGRRAGENGTAILVTPDRKQAVYSLGDEIINGVTLKAVNPDFIVLSQDGRLERLTFDKDGQTGLMTPPNTADLTSANLSPADFMQSVSLTRVDRDNQLIGFRIRAKSSALNLDQYGLNKDDIITHIGREDLTKSRPKFDVIARDIARARSIKIGLIRNGAPLTLTVGQP